MIPVGALTDIPLDEAVRVIADVPIAVFRVSVDGAADWDGDTHGTVYAIDDTCTHQRASLSEGWVEDCMVECPLHAVCFDLRTGEPDGLLTKTPVRTHQVVVVDGVVYVRPSAETGPTAVPEIDVA